VRPSPILAALCAAVTAADPQSAAEGEAAPAPPPRVLVYTVSAGYEHDVARRPEDGRLSIVEQALVQVAARTREIDAVVTRDADWFAPERLAQVDVVFFFTTGDLPLDEAQRKALLAFVQDGGGFAGAHCAADTFYGFPAYAEMLGGTFDGHPWNEEVGVRVEDPMHPATRHLGASFAIADEIYQFRAPYDRERLHVLLSLDPRSVDLEHPEVRRSDGDFALAWCRSFGKGRVFYTALGHRPEVWADRRFQDHLVGGLVWAAGRELRAAADEKR
jgi:type 1 glutamine amidotransferase